jgi:predicted permease
LKDGVTASQAQASIYPIAQQWKQRYPTENLNSHRVQFYSLSGLERMRKDGVPIELILFFAFLVLAAGIVLLIACANVAGLLLARGANRSREIAVRLALGAGRFRLLQQLLTESFLLASFGAAAGIGIYALAATLVDQIQIRLSFPLELHLSLDAHLLAFAVGLAFLATILSGLAPALQTSNNGRHIGSRQIGVESRPRWSPRRMLVVGQFALAFVLLVSAALFLRSLGGISRVDPGFDVKHLVTAEVNLDRNLYTQRQAERYFESAIAKISHLPGVRSVSGAAVVPLGVEHWVMSMKAGEQIIQLVHVNSVTPGYFRTMRIPVLSGRDFEVNDRTGGRAVAIVNQTFARKYLNNHALDAQVFIPTPGTPPTFSGVHVVGVVADSKYGSLGEYPTPALYWPSSQQYRPLVIQVSTQAPASGDVTAIRETLTRLDPHIPVKLRLMQEQLAGALLPSRIASVLLGAIGSLGLLLAMIGLYGVMAYSVSRRTAEIGMRLALGATRMQVLQMVLRDASRMVSTGMALGLLMALLIIQPLAALLSSGMSVIDPISFASVGAVLSIIGLLAAFIPAWGASRVDPIVALRSE